MECVDVHNTGVLVQFGGSGTTYYALVIAVVLYIQVVQGTKVRSLVLS
jgi:hypothetical protein